MNCYRCDSDQELSIKARHRNGTIRIMICRTCRNSLAKKYSQTRIPPEPKLTPSDEWNLRAIESYGRVLAKYG